MSRPAGSAGQSAEQRRVGLQTTQNVDNILISFDDERVHSQMTSGLLVCSQMTSGLLVRFQK